MSENIDELSSEMRHDHVAMVWLVLEEPNGDEDVHIAADFKQGGITE